MSLKSVEKRESINSSISEDEYSNSGTYLTIIIPAFNESQRIPKTLKEIDDYIFEQKISNQTSVIIVNDGSTDDTSEVVENWINKSRNNSCFSIINYSPNQGKGYAVREGFLKANSELVFYTDADGASPILEISKLLSCIDNGYDVVCGSRILKAEGIKVKMGFKRRFTGLIFHLILRIMGLANLSDTQCGFKLFKTFVAKKLAENQKCFGYSFDVELLYLAKKMGYKIKEISVNWYHVEGSKINLLRDSIKMLIEVLKIRFSYKYNINELKN